MRHAGGSACAPPVSYYTALYLPFASAMGVVDAKALWDAKMGRQTGQFLLETDLLVSGTIAGTYGRYPEKPVSFCLLIP